MATIGDVARRAGVSTTLVSRYLNGVKGVSPASKEKIENAIRELNYVPDESARMLVRRRGGGAQGSAVPSQPQGKDMLPTSVALLCEDVDAQLISAFYLGAKHALWANEIHHGIHILLFCIPADEYRLQDQDETLSYIGTVCRGLLCIGASESLREKLTQLNGALPVVCLDTMDNAKTLYRTAPDFKAVLSKLESDSGAAVIRLCDAIDSGETVLTVQTAITEYGFTVSDEPYKEYSPVGRRLQSHLL